MAGLGDLRGLPNLMIQRSYLSHSRNMSRKAQFMTKNKLIYFY